jgi:hypothetical protein
MNKTIDVTAEVWQELEKLRVESKAGSLNQVINLLLIKYHSAPEDPWVYRFVSQQDYDSLMKTLKVEEG